MAYLHEPQHSVGADVALHSDTAISLKKIDYFLTTSSI